MASRRALGAVRAAPALSSRSALAGRRPRRREHGDRRAADATRSQPWNADTDNLVAGAGHGRAERDARSRACACASTTTTCPKPTDAQGHFIYLARPHAARPARRHRHGRVGREGRRASRSRDAEQRRADARASAAINVAYAVQRPEGLAQRRRPARRHRPARRRPTAPRRPRVGLLTYQLTGTVTDSNGKPVSGAQVSTRTLDRDYWTVSTVTDAKGHYSSLFTASAEAPGEPGPVHGARLEGRHRLPVPAAGVRQLPAAEERAARHPAAAARLRDGAPAAASRTRARSTPGSSSASRSGDAVVAPGLGDLARPRRALRDHAAAEPRRARRSSLWEGKLNLFSRGRGDARAAPIDLSGLADDAAARRAARPRRTIQLK